MIAIKKPISDSALGKIKLRKPPKGVGEYWQGIKHSILVGLLTEAIATRHWLRLNKVVAVSKDKFDMIVSFDFNIPKISLPLGSGVRCLSLSIMTSNAQRFAMKVYLGIRTEDDVGMVFQEFPISAKHTNGFDLAEMINTILNLCELQAGVVVNHIKTLEKRTLTENKYNSILQTAGRKEIMPWSRLGLVDSLGKDINPKTCWFLYKHFCMVAQRSPVFRQLEQMNEFVKLLPKER